jgi:hypothetical protein
VPEQPASGVGDFAIGIEEKHPDAGGDVGAAPLLGRAGDAELVDDPAARRAASAASLAR